MSVAWDVSFSKVNHGLAEEAQGTPSDVGSDPVHLLELPWVLLLQETSW